MDREENVLINGVVESPERPSEEKLLITFFASLLFTLKKTYVTVFFVPHGPVKPWMLVSTCTNWMDEPSSSCQNNG